MRDTGFTHTATLWRWSSAVIAIMLFAACVRSTQRYFVASPEQERIDTGMLRTRGDALLAAECPRLRGERETDLGDADFTITVDSQGYVTRAKIDKSSGDERIDQIFGGLTAALKFEPPASMPASTIDSVVTLGYSCSPTIAVITFQIKEPGGDSTYAAPAPPPNAQPVS